MGKAMGKAKEAYGAMIGDEAKKAEGRAEQRKAQAEVEAKQAEKERDRQRLKDKGALGDITDATESLGGITDKLTGR